LVGIDACEMFSPAPNAMLRRAVDANTETAAA
jgi:hypothetical protein